MVTISWPGKVWAFIKLGRFTFLAGGFILFGLGAAMAFYNGISIDWRLYIWGQTIVTMTQLMVHYCNDYFDVEADAANQTPTRWSGGSRVLMDAQLSPEIARTAALSLAGGAVLLSFLLALFVHAIVLPVLLLSIGLSWSYSAPPLQLHSRGLGEISGVMIVTGFTPVVSYLVQAGDLAGFAWQAMLPLYCLQFNMLLSVALPDADGDAQVGKRTLVVHFGRRKSAKLYLTALLVAYGSLPVLVLWGLPSLVGVAAALTAPVALWQAWRVWHGAWLNPNAWDSIAFFSIALLMSTITLELLAFLIIS